jgi:hypothetical protein
MSHENLSAENLLQALVRLPPGLPAATHLELVESAMDSKPCMWALRWAWWDGSTQKLRVSMFGVPTGAYLREE